MNDLRKLRDSTDILRLPTVQPGLPVLRRSADKAAWTTADWSDRMHGTQAQRAGDMDAARAPGSGFTQSGKRPDTACADWPGRDVGIRQPHPGETAPSWQEVNHFLRTGAYA